MSSGARRCPSGSPHPWGASSPRTGSGMRVGVIARHATRRLMPISAIEERYARLRLVDRHDRPFMTGRDTLASGQNSARVTALRAPFSRLHHGLRQVPRPATPIFSGSSPSQSSADPAEQVLDRLGDGVGTAEV